MGLAFPAVVQRLLDAAFQQHDRTLLDRIALFLVGAFALQGVMNFIQVYLLTSTAEPATKPPAGDARGEAAGRATAPRCCGPAHGPDGPL